MRPKTQNISILFWFDEIRYLFYMSLVKCFQIRLLSTDELLIHGRKKNIISLKINNLATHSPGIYFINVFVFSHSEFYGKCCVYPYGIHTKRYISQNMIVIIFSFFFSWLTSHRMHALCHNNNEHSDLYFCVELHYYCVFVHFVYFLHVSRCNCWKSVCKLNAHICMSETNAHKYGVTILSIESHTILILHIYLLDSHEIHTFPLAIHMENERKHDIFFAAIVALFLITYMQK